MLGGKETILVKTKQRARMKHENKVEKGKIREGEEGGQNGRKKGER